MVKGQAQSVEEGDQLVNNFNVVETSQTATAFPLWSFGSLDLGLIPTVGVGTFNNSSTVT